MRPQDPLFGVNGIDQRKQKQVNITTKPLFCLFLLGRQFNLTDSDLMRDDEYTASLALFALTDMPCFGKGPACVLCKRDSDETASEL